MMNTVHEETRYMLRPRDQMHFCPCGATAVTSCTDAKQDPVTLQWTESEPRYGCAAHPARPRIYYGNGISEDAKP